MSSRRLLPSLAGVALTVALMPSAMRAATAPPGFTVAPLVSGLTQPTAAAFAPDGRLFILEKRGTVRVWSASGGLAAEPVVTLPSCTASEMGLLGLAFDPGFTSNGFVYLYHTQPPGDDVRRCAEGSPAGRRNRVVRVTVSGDRADPASLVELLGGIRTDNGNHDGGCLRIGRDGLLYVGVGDTGIGDGGPPGQSTNPYARDLSALEGKILRLARDGGPAPGNPFLGRGGAADFVFASGLRNPFRFAFDPGTDLLWVGDVGQNTQEEIDVVRAGDDLGWPRCEGELPADACPGNTVPPVHVYGPRADGASVTGGVFYDGTQFDTAHRGDYFFGDFIFDVVWRARLDPPRTGFASEPEVFLRDAGGPTDFTVGPDGALHYVAFSTGEIMRVTQDHLGPVSDRCGRALATVAARLIRRADRPAGACGSGCAAPAVPRGLERLLGRACGMPPPDERCEGLGCGACETAGGLGACVATAAASIATEAAQVGGASSGDRCLRRVQRVSVRLAGRRVLAQARCLLRGGTACDAGGPSVRGTLGAACRRPSSAACAALACTACTAGGLATCVERTVAAPADVLARTLLGE